MASYNKVNDYVEDINEGVHDWSSDTPKIALSDTAPSSETSDPTADGNGVLANVTEIDYTNCSSRTVTVSSSTQSGGTYQLTLSDLTLSASGGSVGPFRYVYVYNSSAASNELVAYYDYGKSVTLNDSEDFDVDFDDTNGLLQVA